MERFEYEAEGDELNGWIYHPAGEGPWPTIVWVYPGLRYGARPPRYAGVRTRYFLNANVLVSAGYAVLFPSIPPLKPADGLERLSEGVLPALDAAIAAGWTDAERVGGLRS